MNIFNFTDRIKEYYKVISGIGLIVVFFALVF
jgi:hypothetical protein